MSDRFPNNQLTSAQGQDSTMNWVKEAGEKLPEDEEDGTSIKTLLQQRHLLREH